MKNNRHPKTSPELESVLVHYFSVFKEKGWTPSSELIMLALLDMPEIKKFLKDNELDRKEILDQIYEYLQSTNQNFHEKATHKNLEHLKDAMANACHQANKLHKNQITPAIYLLTLISGDAYFCQKVLSKLGVNVHMVLTYFAEEFNNRDIDDDGPEFSNDMETDTEPVSDKEQQKSVEITSFMTNLTAKMAQQKPTLIGREAELDRIIQVLSRKTKNNPILLGEPGTGKTAIIEALAYKLSQNDVPDLMKGAQLISVDMGALIAGTKLRGEVEERVQKILKYVENKGGKAILFIDEIHNIMGAGSASEKSMDVANLLKPKLQGGLKCIGTTTYEEYRTVLSKDKALIRRFQKVDIQQPDAKETTKILQGLKPQYESFHEVTIADELITLMVELSGKYMADKFFPDKAIDLMDEVCCVIKNKQGFKKGTALTQKDVEDTLSRMVNIPSINLTTDTLSQLKNLESVLKSNVFGQDKAISQVVKNLIVAKSGFTSQNRPVGNFVFVGATGTGKTELAKQLAKFQGSDLIRLDMSEFMDKSSASKLIGTTAGYVGYDTGGLLTNEVAKKPNAVVLLDEIEKAHPDIQNLLLQVMDNGFMTDGSGKQVDFRQTTLIMTSNLGADKATEELRSGLGLLATSQTVNGKKEAVEKFFKPEFINRLDAIIQFNNLNETDMLSIVDKFLKADTAVVESKGYHIKFTDSLKAHLAKKGFDPKMGARPMQRLIKEQIQSALAEMMLFGSLEKGDTIVVDYQNNEVSCSKEETVEA